MVDILDGQFPKKQCKERGRALVMLSYIEMALKGKKFDESGTPTAKCKQCWDKGYRSELIGGYHIGADFEGDKVQDTGMKEVKNFCKCAKGKRLKREYENQIHKKG